MAMRTATRRRPASRRRGRAVAAASAAALATALASCTGGGNATPSPPPTGDAVPCRTDVLAGWRTAGLAVLWVPRPGNSPDNRVALPAAVAAMDVRTGQIRSYCPLPALTVSAPTVSADWTIPMRQGATAYPDAAADVDLMLRTQWFSPDFRWFGGPGLPLVDVAAGEIVRSTPPGLIAGVGVDRVLLLKEDGSWCTAPLPPGPSCTRLLAPATPGTYVIGPDGAPRWLAAQASPLPFGPVAGYAVVAGDRIYRADTEPAAERSRQRTGDPVVPVDLDPAGLGGFQASIDAQPRHDQGGWFALGPGGTVTYHHTTARPGSYGWLLGDAAHVSRALADGGRTAVSAVPGLDGSTRITRFGALVDGTDQVLDLTRQRGLRCPTPDSYCRILAWPDGSAET